MATQAKNAAKPSTHASKTPAPAHDAEKPAAKHAAGKHEPSPETKQSHGTLESRLSDAIGLMHAKKADEALAAFEALAVDAETQGHFGIVRTARTYASALRSHSKEASAHKAPSGIGAVMLLNREESAEALAQVEKALKAGPESAHLYYLKATAHAQLNDAEASAQALKKAIEMDATYLYTYRIEADFESIRNSAAFAHIESR